MIILKHRTKRNKYNKLDKVSGKTQSNAQLRRYFRTVPGKSGTISKKIQIRIRIELHPIRINCNIFEVLELKDDRTSQA